MTETIKILERTVASITIFEAMVKACPKSDMLEKFGLTAGGDDTVANVAMQVNGVEVPVKETLTGFLEMFDEYVKREAKKMALDMVQGAGLRELVAALEQSEWRIQDALDRFNRAEEERMKSKGT